MGVAIREDGLELFDRTQPAPFAGGKPDEHDRSAFERGGEREEIDEVLQGTGEAAVVFGGDHDQTARLEHGVARGLHRGGLGGVAGSLETVGGKLGEVDDVDGFAQGGIEVDDVACDAGGIGIGPVGADQQRNHGREDGETGARCESGSFGPGRNGRISTSPPRATGDRLSRAASGGIELLQGPLGVFSDERFGIPGCLLECWEGDGIPEVAEGNGDVPEEAAAFGAEEGCAVEHLLEPGGIELEQREQRGGIEIGTSMRGKEAGFGGEPVPRTGGETVVTAKDPGTDERAQGFGDGSLEFNGEVRDATAGIEGEWRGQGVGGTGGQTGGAATAPVAGRWIGGQDGLGEDLGEEEPVAEGSGDEIGVAADESDAGALGEIAFEKRAGIDIPQGAVFRPGQSVEEPGQFIQRPGEQIVVIRVARIPRHHTVRRWIGSGGRGGIVGNGEDDQGTGSGQDQVRVAAFVSVAGEPFHAGMTSLGEGLAEAGGGFRGVGGGETAGVESQGEGLGAHGGCQGDGVGIRRVHPVGSWWRYDVRFPAGSGNRRRG